MSTAFAGLGGTFALDQRYGKFVPGVVTHDGGAVPSDLPDENVIMFGPFGGAAGMFWNLPNESYMIYVHATPAGKAAHEERIKAGNYLLFKPADPHGDGPIHEIWKRAPADMIAIARVAAGTEGTWKDVIYVDMMAVRKEWRRNKLNTVLMRTFVKEWPGRKLAFSNPTHDGEAFIKAARAAGLPVEGKAAPSKAKASSDPYDLDALPKSTAQVNALFKARKIPWKIHNGDGYFYFIPDDPTMPEIPSVYVYRVGELSFRRWLESLEGR